MIDTLVNLYDCSSSNITEYHVLVPYVPDNYSLFVVPLRLKCQCFFSFFYVIIEVRELIFVI